MTCPARWMMTTAQLPVPWNGVEPDISRLNAQKVGAVCYTMYIWVFSQNIMISMQCVWCLRLKYCSKAWMFPYAQPQSRQSVWWTTSTTRFSMLLLIVLLWLGARNLAPRHHSKWILGRILLSLEMSTTPMFSCSMTRQISMSGRKYSFLTLAQSWQPLADPWVSSWDFRAEGF